MNPPILNIAHLDLQPMGSGDHFEARIGRVSARLGAQRLGYNVTVLPPGKRAFPLHNHRVNEEMFLILAGEGVVRIGIERHPVMKGDVIACPPGGPETAHQIINTSTEHDLQFLAVSTKLSPEIAEYPDSGKFGVLAEFPPGPDGEARTFRHVGRAEQSLDYWEGNE